jgi:hypothetical protein
MGYIIDLRKIVGSSPLTMPGMCIIMVNGKSEILLQRRTDNHC